MPRKYRTTVILADDSTLHKCWKRVTISSNKLHATVTPNIIK